MRKYLHLYIILFICCEQLLDEDPPSSPINFRGYFTMDNNQPRVRLSWEKPPSNDILEYHIFKSVDNGSSFDSLGKILFPLDYYEDTTITWQENIYYKIRAKDQSTNIGVFSDSIFIYCYKPAGNWQVLGLDSLFLCVDPITYSTPEIFRIQLDSPLDSIGDTNGIMDFSQFILDTNLWKGNGWMYYTFSVIEFTEDSLGYDTVVYANTVAPEFCTIDLLDPENGIIYFESDQYESISLEHNKNACDGSPLFPL
tara:strand:+ start:148 stop:909 length:762 start_codon:yes stop_codon:yes gene_type:complete